MPNLKQIHRLMPSDEVNFFPGVACNKLNCRKTFDNREAVVAHIKKDHVKRYKCRHCGKTTSRLGRTKQHQQRCPLNPEVMARQVESELPSELIECSSWPAEDTLSVTAGDDLLADLCRDEGVSEAAAVPMNDAISLPTVARQTVGDTRGQASVAGPALPEARKGHSRVVDLNLHALRDYLSNLPTRPLEELWMAPGHMVPGVTYRRRIQYDTNTGKAIFDEEMTRHAPSEL